MGGGERAGVGDSSCGQNPNQLLAAKNSGNEEPHVYARVF